MNKPLLCAAAACTLLLAAGVSAQQSNMSFFVTSSGPGKGADLGGIAGADKHCQTLAESAGARGKTWHAYLSQPGSAGQPAVNARDRIGRGPWTNAKGVVVARSVEELHGGNNLTKETDLTEKGDSPSLHDVITGSRMDGTAFPAGDDTTCGNYTKAGAGAVQLGHLDRRGLTDDEAARSWNSSHPSRGCSQDNLRSTGGAGLLYCFAVN
jgi:hypothetical protein